jgi:hypothetical protein
MGHDAKGVHYLSLEDWDKTLRNVSGSTATALYLAAVQWLKHDPQNPHVHQMVRHAATVLSEIDPTFKPAH